MKNYDFQLAKKIIEAHKDKIERASLGMQEDWFWTANTIFEEGDYQIDLSEVKEIAGIEGSYWATPVLFLEYKDGTEETFECYTGENQGDHGESAIWASGVLSSNCKIPSAKKYTEGATE